MSKLRLVVATRVGEQSFFSATATGRSLSWTAPPYGELRVFADNRLGLPAVYNQAIREAESDPAVLVFAHDDLLLTDFFWPQRILEALRQFDVVGVVGNRRRVPGQPSWAFLDRRFTVDSVDNVSGVLGHGRELGQHPLNTMSPPRQAVKLLDGLLLAVDSATLHRHGLRFDERFDFHFYDMDFCRQVEALGLRCGTWDLSVVHASGGSLGDAAWQRAYEAYLSKWGE